MPIKWIQPIINFKAQRFKTDGKKRLLGNGSNGYRLTYINIFNDKGQSLGVIDENNVPNKTTIEYYNHYLMDFIRNQYMIPSETRQEMEARIKKDYNLMQDIYHEELGKSLKPTQLCMQTHFITIWILSWKV